VDTLLKTVLTQRHLQRYGTFAAEYERVAAKLGPDLTPPSRAQYFRWLDGQLKGGAPYPDACRVLEAMLPPYSAGDLFRPPSGGQRIGSRSAADNLLEAVPPSFPAKVLAGAWVTCYQFSQPAKHHVDIAHIAVSGDRLLHVTNSPPTPRTEGHPVPFRNTIRVQLVGRHLLGTWKNDSDTRYFGALHLAALPGENLLAGYYTGYDSDIAVSGGRWTWVRLEPDSFAGVDLAWVSLRDPHELAGLLDAQTQYDPPLPLAAVIEEPS
jgi:hypothetical protein